MKFLHLGDLHLGKSLGEFDLINDQKYILNQILEIIREEAVDVVLIAGDVYDRALPSEAATSLLDYFLCCLAQLKVKTFVISGNHDSDDRLNYGSGLFEANQIFISAIYNGVLYKQTLEDENGELDIYLLPFVKASQVKHFFPEEKIATYDDAVRVILDHAEIDCKKRNVLVAHQFVAGKESDPKFGGSEGPSVQNVGLVEKIGYDCFDAFDYVALGHIHSAQRVGREEVRYSGSPLKYSLSEVNSQKSVTVITMEKKETVDIKSVPLKPKRDLRHIMGRMEKLLDKKYIEDTDDFIYVTLTDEDVINDAMGIFQQVYPNTIKIDYDNSHTKEIEMVDITKLVKNKSFDELISDFYRQMYGCEISEDEMRIMKQVAEEVKIIDEAD